MLYSCGCWLDVQDVDRFTAGAAINASLVLPIETFLIFLFLLTYNIFSSLPSIRKGPSYTGCNGFLAASCRRKTHLQFLNSLYIDVFSFAFRITHFGMASLWNAFGTYKDWPAYIWESSPKSLAWCKIGARLLNQGSLCVNLATVSSLDTSSLILYFSCLY